MPDICTLRYDESSPPVVVVEGEVVDPADELQLYDAICAAVTGATSAVYVDLSSVPFMGSVGINALIRASAAAARVRCEVAVIAAPPRVREILEVTGCADLLRLSPEG